MLKKHVNFKQWVKDSIVPISVFIGGAVLTATSLCLYFLVKPLHIAALIVICAVDFAYIVLSACLSFKYMPQKQWLLNGILTAIGYIAAFITIPTLYFVFTGAYETLKNVISVIACLAFLVGPCVMLVLPLFIFIVFDQG